MSESELISIIIPTFNRSHLIEETLNSVKSQTYTNWECLIVDDGSIDDTKPKVDAYIKKDSRFKYYDRPNTYASGGNGARNYGAKKSKGDWLIFLDSDDLLTKSTLLDRMNPNAVFDMQISITGTFKREIGDSNKIWNKVNSTDSHIELINRYINMDMPWHTSGVTWNAHFFNKIGGWNERLSAWQDWEIHCRSLFFKPKLHYIINKPDNYFRISRHDSIGETVKSQTYMRSVFNSFLSLDELLKKNKDVFEMVKVDYEKLLCKMLITFPIKKGFLFFPLKSLLKMPFFKGANRFLFLKCYIIELLAKSNTLKTKVLNKSYIKQQDFVKLKSNYLKFTINDL
ncbi:glycosyltransferase family 2 protein [uncultured Winogradskyella sp.]|uniref:glycosyltransferase family 2 protein n=1 Tax=uncultured Winogradskyella sp. TaxID=395353 RepID=UPI0026180B0F|nr:glycosyltransferase family 2 protein [uncultured Winogradskyella sp.]